MKRLIPTFLAFSLLCTLAGCQKGTLPQPDFPLSEDVITAALEQTGLPGVISDSETYSSVEGHIAYTLRDPEETYGDTENRVVIAGVSSAITEGERFLAMVFTADSIAKQGEPGTRTFAWEYWKQQFVFATLLYGGFLDEEEVYRAFSDKETPEDERRLEWDAQLSGAYVRVSRTFMEYDARSAEPYSVRVTFYESKSLYEKQYEEMMKRKEELDQIPAETPN